MLLIPETGAPARADGPVDRPIPLAGCRPSPFQQLMKRGLLRKLDRLTDGAITLVDGTGTVRVGTRTASVPLDATIHVRDPRFYTDVALDGTIGAGRAYIDGLWTCDDLTTLVRILVRNREALDACERGLAWLASSGRSLLHMVRRNSRSGSRRNIAAHYDLSNDFFAAFLDDTMTYSCGYFETPDSSLRDASIAKNDRICRKLGLSPNHHVLEIGTGWGGFALHAAGRYGCRVTTTTVSSEQYAYARRRIDEAGLSDRITLLLRDYRDLNGRFDRLVSIEMIEAVGHAFYPTYFRRCSELLEPDGSMLLQAIVIEDRRYEQARRSVDFIKQHVFPGSCIPSIGAICAAVAGETDLRLHDLEDIGTHYVPTLRAWRQRLQDNAGRVRSLGFPDPLLRLWEFYLCYCEGGFAERSISDVQMLLVKPRSHPHPVRDRGASPRRP